MRKKDALAQMKGDVEILPPRAGGPRRGYERDLPAEYAARYIDFFGDTNPFHEVSLVRVTLSRILELLQKEFDEIAADETSAVSNERLRRLELLMRSINKASEVIARANDQITGKKVVVTFQSTRIGDEVRTQAEEFVKDLLEWLPGCLCLDCRHKLSDELQSRQRVTVNEETVY